MSVLGLIPARGGSERLPRKNLATLGGKPLLAWTIEAALACPRIDRVVVTTDDAEIAAVARNYGAEVPFMRPPELAGGDVDDLPVFRHALAQLGPPAADVVVWLRPTAPLRTADDIAAALDVFESSGADVVRSVCLSDHHPYWMKLLDGIWLKPFAPEHDESRYPRHQLLPQVYRLNGAVDVVRTSAVERNGSLLSGPAAAYVMPAERSVDIDTELDLRVAEALLEERA